MISRCPSCGAQVDDDAQQCPQCFWDFLKFKHIPPAHTRPSAQEAAAHPTEAPDPGPVRLPPLPSAPVKSPTQPQTEASGFAIPQLGKNLRVPLPASQAPELVAAPAQPEAVILTKAPAKAPPAVKAQPPLTEVRAGAGWGAPPAATRPAAAKPSGPGPATIQRQSRRDRSSLLSWVTGGIAVAGVLFVIATRFVMRSDVETVGRTTDLPSFPKDAQPQFLPLSTPGVAQAQAAPAAAVAAPQPPVAGPVPAPKPASAAAAPPPVAAPTPAPVPSAAAVPKPRPKPSSKPLSGPHWRFSGVVYDLISLRPVYAATLTFKDGSGKVCGEASTGEDGSYAVVLEPLTGAGYSLSVEQSDYQPRAIDEINPPFKEVSLQERRGVAGMSAGARPWIGRTDKPVHRDLVLVPKELGQ